MPKFCYIIMRPKGVIEASEGFETVADVLRAVKQRFGDWGGYTSEMFMARLPRAVADGGIVSWQELYGPTSKGSIGQAFEQIPETPDIDDEETGDDDVT